MSSNESDSDKEYEVATVIAARVCDDPDDPWEYRVRWAGYGENDDSWEPNASLMPQCESIIRRFWAHIGMDDKDYHVGYQTPKAHPTWIGKQIKRFYTDLATSEDSKKDKDSDKGAGESPRKTTKSKSTKSKSKSVKKRPTSPVKRELTPARKRTVSRSSARRGRSVAVITSSEEEDDETPTDADSGDDRPLSQLVRQKPSNTETKRQPSQSRKLTKPEERAVRKPAKQAMPAAPPSPTVSEANSLFDDHEILEKKQAVGSNKPKSTVAAGTARRQEPRRGIMLMLDETTTVSATGLSHKQRVWNKISSTPIAPPPRSEAIKNMTFKKNSKAPPVPASASTSTFHDPSNVDEPRLAVVDDLVDSPMSIHNEDWPTGPSEVPMLASNPLPTQLAADEFLNNMSVASPSTGTAIKSTKSIRALPKIGKIWSWNGDCRLTTSPGTTSQCCKITIIEQKETSRALNSDGASLLKFIMSNKSSLTLGKSYSSSQVGVHLAACGDRSQSVRIGPQDGTDGDRLRFLATHLQKHSLVFIEKLTTSEKDSFMSHGIMLIFSGSNAHLCDALKVEEGKGFEYLIGAVYPWRLSDDLVQAIAWPPVKRVHRGPPIAHEPVNISRLTIKSPHHSQLQRALLLLRFPVRLLNTLARHKAVSYCVWSLEDHHQQPAFDVETRALRIVLKNLGCRDVGHKDNVQYVFIHVGALQSIYRLLALNERRAKRAEISFILYGTHPSVHPKRWGVRDIWPLGGVCTFTPAVLAQEPELVVKFIRAMDKHPWWTTFILPSVLGAALQACNPTKPEVLVREIGHTIVEPHAVLDAVNQRHVAMFRPLARSPVRTSEAVEREASWITEQICSSYLDIADFIEMAVAEYSTLYGQTAESLIPITIRKDITNELHDLQTRPPMLGRYRRYVVIGHKSDQLAYRGAGWFEFDTLATFKGRDDYPYVEPVQ